jgi:hypothetical protein
MYWKTLPGKQRCPAATGLQSRENAQSKAMSEVQILSPQPKMINLSENWGFFF